MRTEELLGEMHQVILSPALPVFRLTLEDFLESFESPVFRSHPRYSQAARIMRRFLNSTAIVVEQGDSESAKSIETIYEQWAFFQMCAALQSAGLTCISHNSIYEPIARNRFSVDLDRNAAIEFEDSDTRRVRLRYEPTILPRSAAKGIDTLFRANASTPCTPDIVLEVLEAHDDQRDYRLVYAVVIDAKYTTRMHIQGYLKQVKSKYLHIQNVNTSAQIARQVWVIAPVAASIEPDDDAVTWSREGEVEAHPRNVITGVIGADPATTDQTRSSMKSYVLGVLNHARAYANTNSL